MAQPMPRTDPAPNNANDAERVLRLSRVFDAPIKTVFRAWTEPRALASWFGPKGMSVPERSLDVRVGGAWRVCMRHADGGDSIVSGVYRVIEPPRRLVFTLGWENDGVRGHETVVTIELVDQGGSTLLDLTQELFESETSRDQHGGGWTSSFDCLADHLSGGTA